MILRSLLAVTLLFNAAAALAASVYHQTMRTRTRFTMDKFTC
jgi:hypothetical protein